MNRAMIEASVAEAKGDEFANGIGDMKKNDAAAYAEKAVKGTGWLPAPLVLANAPETTAGEADECDAADIIQFPEAAA